MGGSGLDTDRLACRDGYVTEDLSVGFLRSGRILSPTEEDWPSTGAVVFGAAWVATAFGTQVFGTALLYLAVVVLWLGVCCRSATGTRGRPTGIFSSVVSPNKELPDVACWKVPVGVCSFTCDVEAVAVTTEVVTVKGADMVGPRWRSVGIDGC